MAGLLATPLFVQIIALSGLAAIAAILIHLFSKSKAARVLFPHLALLPDTKQKPVVQLMLSQRRLLLLRLLLIALVGLLLSQWLPANPFERHSERKVLVSKDWLNFASAEQKKQLFNSADTSKIWLLDKQASRLDQQRVAQYQTDQAVYVGNLWAQIKQHTMGLGEQSQLDVYVSDRASQFVGAAVAIRQTINWHVLDTSEQTQTPLPVIQVDVIVDHNVDTHHNLDTHDQSSDTHLKHWRFAFDLLQSKLKNLQVNYYQASQTPAQMNGDWLVNLSSQPIKSSARQLESLSKEVMNPEFALLLAQALVSESATLQQIQAHKITAEQLQLSTVKPKKPKQQAAPNVARLQSVPPSWLVLLTILVFVSERIFSERTLRDVGVNQ